MTLRTLVDVAQENNWGLDTRISIWDPDTGDHFCASIMPGAFGDDDWTIDLDGRVGGRVVSKRTDRAYAELHRSREGLDRMLGMLVIEGMLDPREADRPLEAISRLNEA